MNDIRPSLHQLCGKPGKQIEMVLGEAEVELDISAVDIAQFVERFEERCGSPLAGSAAVEG
jgi:hypothetical protein